MAPVGLNIVCFRFNPGRGDLDALNEELLIRLHESGIAVVSVGNAARSRPPCPIMGRR